MNLYMVIVELLFFISDFTAILSLFGSDWIISNSGDLSLGLLWTCVTIYKRSETCFTPNLSHEWLLTLICIFMGCVCITTTFILIISSYWDRNILFYARWIGFSAMVLFCIAAIMFPMGFYIDEIGGKPYNLPTNFQIGDSFRLFHCALFFTIITEMVASRACFPLI